MMWLSGSIYVKSRELSQSLEERHSQLGLGRSVSNFNKLFPVEEITLEPCKICSSDAEVVRQAVGEDGVGNCVESCKYVRENEDADVACMSLQRYERSLGILTWAVSVPWCTLKPDWRGLYRPQVDICWWTRFFQDFTEEGEVEDMPVWCRLCLDLTFLENGGDFGELMMFTKNLE